MSMNALRSLIISLFFLTVSGGCVEEQLGPEVEPLKYEHPENHQVASVNLLALDSYIKDGNYGDVSSLIITRGNNVIFENYYNGFKRDELCALGRATASISSLLIGAIDDSDFAQILDRKIIDLLPEYETFFEGVPQKDLIRVDDLLKHTSGIWWNEWGMSWEQEDNDAYVMSQSDHWIEHVLGTPMIREPGFEFNYNSGHAILLAPVIGELSGEQVEELSARKLFEPLSIEHWQWDQTPEGNANTAWGLHLRPIDMAKIGYLFLEKGKVDGTQIISEDWINRSTVAYNAVAFEFDYGLQWWKFNSRSNVVGRLRTNDLIFAWGEGGQFLFIMPSLKSVMVVTSSNSLSDETLIFGMLRDYIMPSLLTIPLF